MTDDSKYIAVLNPAGFVLRVVRSTVACPEGEREADCVEIPDWSGWPQAPFEGAELRLVDGAFAWAAPQSLEAESNDARSELDKRIAAANLAVRLYLEKGERVPEALRSYRQVLRDWPQQPGWQLLELPAQPLV